MGIFLYSLILIAISVIISTLINILIMIKATEIAVKEINKIEERIKRFVKIMIQK